MTSAAAIASQAAYGRGGAGRRRVFPDPPFQAQAPGDLQPRAIRRRQPRQRRGGVVDALQVVLAARGTPSHSSRCMLELGAADRSEGAVDQLLDRIR